MSAPKVNVLNMLRKFERSYMVAGLDDEAADMATIFSAVSELIETQRGCRDALREAAKQFRCLDDRGHADMCDENADASDALLARIGGAA